MTAGRGDAHAAVHRLARARRALVTGHQRPDGDSLGSQLALAELAGALGVTTVVVNHDPSPSTLAELPGTELVTVSEALPGDFPNGYDLVVAVECPELERAGYPGLDRLPVLNIDHHPANPLYGEVNYVDPDAPATGEMVWRMFRAAGIEPSAAAATNAYVALSTDTGDFRYSNATGRAFRAAAEMVDAGASPTAVALWIHGRRREAAVHLLGEALSTLRLEQGGSVAVIELDEHAFRRSGAGPEDTEDIINHPRAIDGVRAVVFLKQWEAGTVRVSLRSADRVDVRRVAERFGGGGHANAAGCTLRGDLAAARELVVAAVAEAIGSGS
jgi:bifunctional oligoribonuclease and PAP phosphatase NrnA